eukprot:CAMPEP_0170565364 /NCGR_PEP_ID=MMETSP0211-20121228/78398_1 /TAXON_ID=311385 /ORGANISM="Pseudokeronopsis sp., Strain OXSARD2" /LENGTH=75 /DNA_ID=CAMNT_0010886075 /DNA_START=324 /DNA_END=551 /DNA_ORIENTATION=-
MIFPQYEARIQEKGSVLDKQKYDIPPIPEMKEIRKKLLLSNGNNNDKNRSSNNSEMPSRRTRTLLSDKHERVNSS